MESSEQRVTYINAAHTVRSWLFTIDHKRIALLYLVSITIMFALGGLFAGDVDRLGVNATFPELSVWERDFGSAHNLWVAGDYLYHDGENRRFVGGAWGILRVLDRARALGLERKPLVGWAMAFLDDADQPGALA